ncbi:hypothetical protein BH09ACT3_BH09ACT3_11550 [soil metagenome]
MSAPTGPSRRDRLRPLEYLLIALVVSVFVGLVVLGTTRQLLLAVVFFGVAFIVSLVGIAMLALAIKPDDAEKLDLRQQDEQDRGH